MSVVLRTRSAVPRLVRMATTTSCVRAVVLGPIMGKTEAAGDRILEVHSSVHCMASADSIIPLVEMRSKVPYRPPTASGCSCTGATDWYPCSRRRQPSAPNPSDDKGAERINLTQVTLRSRLSPNLADPPLTTLLADGLVFAVGMPTESMAHHHDRPCPIVRAIPGSEELHHRLGDHGNRPLHLHRIRDEPVHFARILDEGGTLARPRFSRYAASIRSTSHDRITDL